MENVIVSLATIIARQEREIESLRRSKSNGSLVTQYWYEMLLACYRSGQMSERQWQAHLEDKMFRKWVEDQLPINYPSACSGRDNPGQEAGGRNA